ncbi:MAG: MBL fold metallo-hydrolase, partial [Acidobacteriaceae bacterium]|nr:MBL fold metallo-hydrolase [Acidobacteriaceae bacterium]
ALSKASGTKLVMLGTGAGPNPTVPGRTRYMTSHVMVSNGSAYVLDCGLGVTNQFARTGVPFTAVRSIFITHHHPDHNIEYGPFILLGWVQDQNVRVSAAIVQHPPVQPALAYRFDFHDRSIVFSGDTAPIEAVARLAEGADILVHEALYVPALGAYVRDRIAKGSPIRFDAYMAHMEVDHSPVEDVGRIANAAGVQTLVLSHLTPAIDGIQDETWRHAAAKQFKGKIVVAGFNGAVIRNVNRYRKSISNRWSERVHKPNEALVRLRERYD